MVQVDRQKRLTLERGDRWRGLGDTTDEQSGPRGRCPVKVVKCKSIFEC